MEHVIRTRMFVTDVSKWEEVARVHGEVFAEIRPATSILEVAKLIDADGADRDRGGRGRGLGVIDARVFNA